MFVGQVMNQNALVVHHQLLRDLTWDFLARIQTMMMASYSESPY